MGLKTGGLGTANVELIKAPQQTNNKKKNHHTQNTHTHMCARVLCVGGVSFFHRSPRLEKRVKRLESVEKEAVEEKCFVLSLSLKS
jgi:hypothetical protein